MRGREYLGHMAYGVAVGLNAEEVDGVLGIARRTPLDYEGTRRLLRATAQAKLLDARPLDRVKPAVLAGDVAQLFRVPVRLLVAASWQEKCLSWGILLGVVCVIWWWTL